MSSFEKINNTKKNIIFVMSIVIISNIINCYLNDNTLFSKEWMYSSLAITFSYVIYIYVVEDIKIPKIVEPKYKQLTQNIIRLGTIYTLSKFISTYLLLGTLTFGGPLWILGMILKIGIYSGLDYFLMDYIINLKNYGNLFYNVSKLVLGEISYIYIAYSQFTHNNLLDLTSFSFAYIIWNLFIKKITI
jgi:hypothetical protein